MHKNYLFKTGCFLIFCQLLTFNLAAQVKYSFVRDTIGIKGGETFANMLKVSNGYTETVVLKQNGKDMLLLRGMIGLPDSLVIKAGESRNFPVKYIASRQTIKSNIQVFNVQLLTDKPGVLVQRSAQFVVQLSDIGGLSIGTEDNEVYLSQLSNQAQVLVRVANNGYVPISFRLQLTGIPDGLEFTGQTMNLTLQPGSQQLLPFIARNKTGVRNAADYTVTIQALDNRNNELASKIIRIVSVSSARRMGLNNEMAGQSLPNSVAIRYASNSTNSSFYQLQSNARMMLGKQSTLDYSINADQYSEGNVKGLTVYNTYADFQSKRWGVKVGNIYENLDFSLGGRGIKANVNFNKSGTLSLYTVDNIYQLINQVSNNPAGARVYAVDYSLPNVGFGERRITAIHSKNEYTGLEASQLSLNTRFKLKEGQVLGFEGGYSLEKPLNYDVSSKKGYAGGINYLLKSEDYNLMSTGYYASPYYTGLRRGILQTDVRLIRKLDDFKSLSAHVNIISSNPTYQNQLNNLLNLGINKNETYIYEMGYTTKAGALQLNFNPYYMGQHILVNNVSNETTYKRDWKSRSLRFNTGIGYNKGIHSVSLSADYGYTYLNTSDKPVAPYHSLKVNGSYSLPFVGLTGYAQFNPYYLTDALSVSEDKKYTLYAIGPNLHWNGLKNKLNMQVSGMYNYYGFTQSSNYTASGNVRYYLKGHWSVTADFQYTVTKMYPIIPVGQVSSSQDLINQNLSYNNRQLRVGIEKQFGRTDRNPVKKLELTYYEDRNSNGSRDAGEAAVAGVLVKINGEVALTNSKGLVQFANMKKDSYKVAITNTKGWSLPEPTEVFLDKNKQLEVPLVKTQALNGRLKVVEDKYKKGTPEFTGIKISAIDENGRIYHTLTDDKGMFCFYLPRNKYIVYIETKGLPFSIDNGRAEVLLQGTPVELLTFMYRDQHRKVGITRF